MLREGSKPVLLVMGVTKHTDEASSVEMLAQLEKNIHLRIGLFGEGHRVLK